MSDIPWTEERLARLCLNWFDGFGSRTLRKIENCCLSWSDGWKAKPMSLMACGISERVTVRFADWRKGVDPAQLVSHLERNGIHVLFRDDIGYPDLLLNTADPPDVLFVRGELPAAPGVSVVGTRGMTAYGKAAIRKVVPPLSQIGLAIVSGLALGVDAEAHLCALESGGQTIAVLGTGIDDASIYPRENFALAQDILSNRGALVTEFPPGSGSRKERFPMRNRIIAGISHATVVVEASSGSGSLITAKLALEENRTVLAVPGSILAASSEGTNLLIKNGAVPCRSAEDVLEALHFDAPQLLARARQELPADPLDRAVLEAMRDPIHVDDLAQAARLSSSDVSSRLSVLELKGLAKDVGGQHWVRT